MLRPITYEELLAVELATKGETKERRQYPPEAVAAWLAAEVTRAGAAPRPGVIVSDWATGAVRACLSKAVWG